MKMEHFLFKDSSGKKSATMTAFVWGTLVANAKLLASGLTIWGTAVPAFPGSDYALCLGALGTIYVLRRHPALAEKAKAEG